MPSDSGSSGHGDDRDSGVEEQNDLWRDIPDFGSAEEAVAAAVDAAPNGIDVEGNDAE